MSIPKSSEIAKASRAWLGEGTQQPGIPTVLPRSKTGKISLQAKLANVEAEQAIANAYQVELARTKALSQAMFKSGKAIRYSIYSSGRQIFLRSEAARRRFEPGYRNDRL